MNNLDFAFLILFSAGLLFGALRGLRPSFWLLVMFLSSLLAGMLWVAWMENIILDIVGVGSEEYQGAPGVTVLLLEDRTTAAFFTAFLPTIMSICVVLILLMVGRFLKRFLVAPSRTPFSRISGAIFGLIAAGVLFLLISVQIVRLPWPPAGQTVASSLLLNSLMHSASFLLPALSGGI